ncbi:MAG: hypothetical protein ACREPM_10945 [Gemmatimonadaceae bacterium]
MSRRHMTYRVVALDSDEASQAPAGASGAESDRMVAELSLAAWIASGRQLPSYSRSEMPIRITTLEEQTPLDDE